MKIYHLIIAYDDKTEDLEYIEEYVEEATTALIPFTEKSVELDPEYWDDEELINLITKEGLAEA